MPKVKNTVSSSIFYVKGIKTIYLESKRFRLLRSSLVVYLLCNFASPDPSTKVNGVNEAQGCEGQGSCACWRGDSKQKHTLCLRCGKASELWPWLCAKLWLTGLMSQHVVSLHTATCAFKSTKYRFIQCILGIEHLCDESRVNVD